MQNQEFPLRLISTFESLKYVFPGETVGGGTFRRLSKFQEWVTKAMAGMTMGIGGALSVRVPQFSDSDVKREVAALGEICDLVGVRLDSGGALLALFVGADELLDEALVGKSVLIRDNLDRFKEFTMRVGFTKRGVIADVFYVFTESGKAFHFRSSVQEHCKHGEFFRKTYVLPWGIDISAKSVWGYKGWPPTGYMTGLKLGELEGKLFS